MIIQLSGLIGMQKSVIGRHSPKQSWIGVPVDTGIEFPAAEFFALQKEVIRRVPAARHIYDKFEHQAALDTVMLLVLPFEPTVFDEYNAAWQIMTLNEDNVSMSLSSTLCDLIWRQVALHNQNVPADDIDTNYLSAQQLIAGIYRAFGLGISPVLPELNPRTIFQSIMQYFGKHSTVRPTWEHDPVIDADRRQSIRNKMDMYGTRPLFKHETRKLSGDLNLPELHP